MDFLGLRVLCNPLSGRVRRGVASVERLRADVGPESYREASSPAEVASALGELSLDGASALAIIGGDGTIQAVLTELMATLPEDSWPALIPVPGGSTNMTALDLGAVGTLPASVELLRGGAEMRKVERHLLMVERNGADTLCGMFFGMGLISAGVDFFRRRVRGKVAASERSSLLSALHVVSSIGLGRFEECRVSGRIDDEDFQRGLAFGLVSTLDRHLLGTRPYWGTEDAPLHVTLVDHGARGLLFNLWRVGAGRPGRKLTPERGYVSVNAHRLEYSMDGPFVVDGELFDARAADGPLTLTAPRTVEWWVPQ